MLLVVNDQAEPIKIVWNDESVIISGYDSYFISNFEKGIIKIEHSDFLNDANGNADKIVGAIANTSILVIDSSYFINEINDKAKLIVKNGVYEHSTGDFGYLYFDVIMENCTIALDSCDIVNRKEVLRMQKLIRILEEIIKEQKNR